MTQPIRLVHITTVPQSLSFLSGQIGYLKSKGFEVHALSSPGEDLDRFGRTEGIPVHSADMPRRITPAQDLVALRAISQKLVEILPQIVHAHTPKGGLLGMIASRLAGVPVRIYHIHGLPMMTATGHRRILLTWSEKLACRFADQVLCVSNGIRETAICEKLCHERKIKVLLKGSINGVDSEGRFNPAKLENSVRWQVRERYGIPESAVVLGFVGRLVRDKGLVELAGMWSMLRDHFPNLHMLVIGPLEPQDPVPQDVIHLLKTEQRIHMVGPEPDVPPLYAAMDILVLPTYREGFPLVPMEAASMELPVVATGVPGCTDAVIDGITGTLVPPRDVSALADAVRGYVEDPDLRERHGRAGRERMVRHFQPADMWQAVYEEYERLLTKRCVQW